jgi:Ferritin-like domain
MSRFVEALNEQIVSEFAASQQYVAIAVHYDRQTLQQLATHFYRQAVEERNHALMIVQYLLDSGASPMIPAVEAPRTTFEGPASAVVQFGEVRSRNRGLRFLWPQPMMTGNPPPTSASGPTPGASQAKTMVPESLPSSNLRKGPAPSHGGGRGLAPTNPAQRAHPRLVLAP